MKQWSLVALALFAFAALSGCHRAARDSEAEEPVNQATLTGGTVSRIPITPPPRIDETATEPDADEAEEMSPEPFWPPLPMTSAPARASATAVEHYDTPEGGAARPIDRDIPR